MSNLDFSGVWDAVPGSMDPAEMESERREFLQRYGREEVRMRELCSKMEASDEDWGYHIAVLMDVLKLMCMYHRSVVGLDGSVEGAAGRPSFVQGLFDLMDMTRPTPYRALVQLSLYHMITYTPFLARRMVPALQASSERVVGVVDMDVEVKMRYHTSTSETLVWFPVWIEVFLSCKPGNFRGRSFEVLEGYRGVVEAFITGNTLDPMMYKAVNAMHDFFEDASHYNLPQEGRFSNDTVAMKKALIKRWKDEVPGLHLCQFPVRILYVPGGGEPVVWPVRRSLTMRELMLGGLALSRIRRKYRIPVDLMAGITRRWLGEDILRVMLADCMFY